jgi:hypothetical protein
MFIVYTLLLPIESMYRDNGFVSKLYKADAVLIHCITNILSPSHSSNTNPTKSHIKMPVGSRKIPVSAEEKAAALLRKGECLQDFSQAHDKLVSFLRKEDASNAVGMQWLWLTTAILSPCVAWLLLSANKLQTWTVPLVVDPWVIIVLGVWSSRSQYLYKPWARAANTFADQLDVVHSDMIDGVHDWIDGTVSDDGLDDMASEDNRKVMVMLIIIRQYIAALRRFERVVNADHATYKRYADARLPHVLQLHREANKSLLRYLVKPFTDPSKPYYPEIGPSYQLTYLGEEIATVETMKNKNYRQSLTPLQNVYLDIAASRGYSLPEKDDLRFCK